LSVHCYLQISHSVSRWMLNPQISNVLLFSCIAFFFFF
jgi:hypothetical protein